jgi:hypothetical protein
MILKTPNRVIKSNRLTQAAAKSNLRYGLVDAYNFEADAKTSTETGHDGTVTGATIVPGKTGNCYSFSSSDYITIGDVSTFSFMHQTGCFSISVWIKMNDYSQSINQQILASGGATSLNTGISLEYENRGSWGIYRTYRLSVTKSIDGNVIVGVQAPNYIVSNNDWAHLVFTTKGGVTRFFLNGVEYPTTPVGPHPATGPGVGDATYPLRVGGFYPPMTNSKFTGLIEGLLIYNRPLSQQEVLELYNEGNGRQYPF